MKRTAQSIIAVTPKQWVESPQITALRLKKAAADPTNPKDPNKLSFQEHKKLRDADIEFSRQMNSTGVADGLTAAERAALPGPPAEAPQHPPTPPPGKPAPPGVIPQKHGRQLRRRRAAAPLTRKQKIKRQQARMERLSTPTPRKPPAEMVILPPETP